MTLGPLVATLTLRNGRSLPTGTVINAVMGLRKGCIVEWIEDGRVQTGHMEDMRDADVIAMVQREKPPEPERTITWSQARGAVREILLDWGPTITRTDEEIDRVLALALAASEAVAEVAAAIEARDAGP